MIDFDTYFNNNVKCGGGNGNSLLWHFADVENKMSSKVADCF